MRWYQKVCLLATVPVMLTACAIDVGKLAADMKRPSVTFESPESWACHEQMKIPTGTFDTWAPCQQALHAGWKSSLVQLRQQAATHQGLKVNVVEKPNVVSVEHGPGVYLKTEERVCFLRESDPT